jgi:long-chain acyl-CoA synthetase
MEFDNLYTAYRKVCQKYADRILFKNQGITFNETWNKMEVRALFLKSKGYGKGDIIAILSGSSPEWCLTYMAITAIGAIALPLDTNLTPEQYRGMLQSVEARAVFVSAGFRGIFPDRDTFDIEADYSSDGNKHLEEIPTDKNDICSLLFTSGTTGNPKIVSLTQGNVLHIALVCTQLEEYTENDMTLAMLPLYHVYAFESTFMAPLLTGSSIVFQTSLKGPDIIRTLGENKITIFPAAPQLWELFFDALIAKVRAQSMLKYRVFMFFLKAAPFFRACGLNVLLQKVFQPVHDIFGCQMRFFISGGAPLKKEYFNYYRRMGFYIMEGYGLTETTGPIAIPYYKEAVAGAVGPPIPGNQVKIKDVNADGIGEIWLQGEAVMAGYCKNDEANRKAFDSERFFNTQDLGFVDRRGHIHITGRKKNVIVLDSGKNVYPEELELYFSLSPLIAEISVFGRKIDGRETVYGVIVPTTKGAGSYGAVREAVSYLNRNLPSYKALKNFALSVDPLPRNSTRKVLIDEVIRLLDQGAFQTDASGTVIPRNILTATSIREEEIIGILGKKLQVPLLHANETLSDHQIDSLGLIELIVYLEEALGITVDIEKTNPLLTLEEFVRYLASCDQHSGASLDEFILRSPVTTQVRIFRNPISELVLFLVRIISRTFWNLKIINRAHLVPENAIIVANHQSYLDLPWIISAMPYSLRKHVFSIGKKELSFLRYLFIGSPVLFVDRSGNVTPALKAAADILRSGNSLVIFPEGTRSNDGKLGKFKSGAAYLAYHLGKKIIPVTIKGTCEIMPRNTIIPRFSSKAQGEIIVGKAIDPQSLTSIDELNEHLRSIILKQQG